jgi:hypothetical protein
MKTSVRTLGLAAAFALVGGSAQAAGRLTLDDFTTGPTAIAFSGAGQTSTLEKTTVEHGSAILGQTRSTTLILSQGGNPFDQNASMQIGTWPSQSTSALIVSGGFLVDSRLEMAYGNEARATPLRANLSQYDFIRIHFKGISTGLNFNVEAFTGTAYSQWGCNLSATLYPTAVDVPFKNGQGASKPSMLDGFMFIFQGGGIVGNNFGVTKIELVTRDTPLMSGEQNVPCGG